MGRLLQLPSWSLAALSLLLSGSFCGASPPPDSLPQPPPLPPEMLDKRPEGPPPDLPDPTELVNQLRQLEELLSLSPERLQRLRQTIEFIEKMSAQEREAMRIRLAQVTRMNDDLRREIDDLASLLPEIPKADFSQFWLAASEQEREAVRKALSDKDEAAQTRYLQPRVEAFVEKRDKAFARMRQTLEAKRQSLEAQP